MSLFSFSDIVADSVTETGTICSRIAFFSKSEEWREDLQLFSPEKVQTGTSRFLLLSHLFQHPHWDISIAFASHTSAVASPFDRVFAKMRRPPVQKMKSYRICHKRYLAQPWTR